MVERKVWAASRSSLSAGLADSLPLASMIAPCAVIDRRACANRSRELATLRSKMAECARVTPRWLGFCTHRLWIPPEKLVLVESNRSGAPNLIGQSLRHPPRIYSVCCTIYIDQDSLVGAMISMRLNYLVMGGDNGRLVAQSSFVVDGGRRVCRHLSPYRQYLLGSDQARGGRSSAGL